MSPEKREFPRNFVGMYDTKTAADLQNAVKDLLGDTIKDMLEEEMSEHLGYEKYKHSDNSDGHNGYESKEIMSSAGSFTTDVPQDRDSAFEPKVVKKGHYKSAGEVHSKKYPQPAQFIPRRPVVTQGAVLRTMETTKKWRLPIRDWGKIYGELSIMYE